MSKESERDEAELHLAHQCERPTLDQFLGDTEISRLQSRIEELETRLETLADVAEEETISRGAVEVSLEDKYRDRAAHRRLEDAYIAAMCATSDAIRQARSVLDAHKEGGSDG